MKKTFALIIMLLLCPLYSAAEQPDQHQHASCNYCGMNRVKFAHSRMLIEYDDASVVATCSLHCTALEFALNIDKTEKSIRVGDYNSKQLIDARQAFWVIGGELSGVMTARAKWAFSDPAAAEEFINTNGGSLVGFDQALKAAYEDMYKDTMMIRKKRQMKKMKMQHRQMKTE